MIGRWGSRLGAAAALAMAGCPWRVTLDPFLCEHGPCGVATDSLPVVEALSVTNEATGGRVYAAGDKMRINWRVTDAEGLAASPIDLYVTTSAIDTESWTPILRGYGAARGTTYTDAHSDMSAPSAAPFRLKLVAHDAAGNTSVAALSDWQNTPGWSVFAGAPDRGVGGSGRAAALFYDWSNTPGRFSVDPVTGDIVAIDAKLGAVRLRSSSGLVERVMWLGPCNLPDDGPLPERPQLPGDSAVRFGPDGRLYLAPGGVSPATGTTIYQIDFGARHVRRYVGGGTAFDQTATPLTAFVATRAFAIDEVGALYFVTSCTPGRWTETTGMRLVKATQNPDGTAGVVSVIAGDCTRATPPGGGPMDPLTTSLGDIALPALGTVAVWGGGRYLYFAFYLAGTWKIIDGALYASDVVTSRTGNLAYNPHDGLVYASNGSLTRYVPNLNGANGDTPAGTVGGTVNGPDCGEDGIDAARACLNVHFTADAGPDGTMYFMDGPGLNSARPYRIRFVDGNDTLRTRLGAPPFYAAGRDRRLVRAQFAGIHYKPVTAPSQAAFPAALYFTDREGLVFGHVDPDTDAAVVDLGNQSGIAMTLVSGTPIDPQLSLGMAYAGYEATALTFDDEGLPWLRYGSSDFVSWLVRLDSRREVVPLQHGISPWEQAGDGANPSEAQLWPFGAWQNLTLQGSAAFVIGGFSTFSATSTIKRLDFGANTVTRLMGRPPNGSAPDSAAPGAVVDATLSASCLDAGPCALSYRAIDDRLYFVEDNRLRYVTTPANPQTTTLGTVWASPSGIDNFIFSPGGTQIFYTSGGNLLCHDLVSGRSWCDDSVLGPPAPMSRIARGPNQLAWKDARTLLISTYQGEIYQFDLPP